MIQVGDRVRVNFPEDFRDGKTGKITQTYKDIALVQMESLFFVSMRTSELIPYQYWFRVSNLEKI